MEHSRLVASVSVPSRPDAIRRAETAIVDAARGLNVLAAASPLFTIAVHEALINARSHGNRNRPDAPIDCEMEFDDGCFTLRIFDSGAGFSLDAVAAARVDPHHVEALPENGYGLPIMRSVFPTVRTIWRAGRFGVELAVGADEAVPHAL